jgi:hypothetical protein
MNLEDYELWKQYKTSTSVAYPDELRGAMNLLGPPPGLAPLNKMGTYPLTHYNVLDLYRGRAPWMLDTITGLVVDQVNMYTTVIYPWMRTPYKEFALRNWQFNKVLPRRVPNEGVSRIVGFSSKMTKKYIPRQGIAFFMEKDALNSEYGQELYAKNMLGMAVCIQDGTDYETLLELLHCHTPYYQLLQRVQKHGIVWHRLWDTEIRDYCCASKTGDELTQRIVAVTQTLQSKAATPNLMIADPATLTHASLRTGPIQVRVAYVSFVGDDPKRVMLEGPTSDGLTKNSIAVYASKEFTIGPNQQGVQPLFSDGRVLEFYDMGPSNKSSFLNQITETSDYDIQMFDMDADNLSTVRYKDAVMYSNLFDTKNDTWHPSVRDLIDSYNKDGRDPKEIGARWLNGDDDEERPDDEDGDSKYNSNTNKYPLHCFTSINTEGRFVTPTRMGHIPACSMTPSFVSKISQDMMRYLIKTPQEMVDIENDIKNGAELLNNIDSQPYDHEFFYEVIKENLIDQLDEEGEFRGSPTPEELIEQNYGVKQVEWKPNQHGGLRLPRNYDVLKRVRYPPGYNNWSGILTIAEEADVEDSPYKQIGKVAKAMKNAIEKLIRIRSIVNTPLLDTKNRRPWQLTRDPGHTLFDAVFGARDPLFLPNLKTEGMGGRNTEKDENGRYINIKMLPLYSLKTPPTPDGISRALKELGDKGAVATGELEESDTGGLEAVMFKTMTGVTYKIPPQYLLNGSLLPREMILMNMLGTTTLPMAHALFEAIRLFDRNTKNRPDHSTPLIDALFVISRELKVVGLKKVLHALYERLPAKNTAPEITEFMGFVEKITAIKSSDNNEKSKAMQLLTEITKKVDFDLSSDPSPSMLDLFKKSAKLTGYDVTEPPSIDEDTRADFEELTNLLSIITPALQKLSKSSSSSSTPIFFDFNDIKSFVTSIKDMKSLSATQMEQYATKIESLATKIVMKLSGKSDDVIIRIADDLKTDVGKSRDNKKKSLATLAKDVIGADFYRCGLTSSPELVKTIVDEQIPFARFGDPRVGNLRPWTPTTHERYVPEEIVRRENYISFHELNKLPEGRNLKDSSIVAPFVIPSGAIGKKGDDKKDKAKGTKDIGSKMDRRKKKKKGSINDFFNKGASSSDDSDSDDSDSDDGYGNGNIGVKMPTSFHGAPKRAADFSTKSYSNYRNPLFDKVTVKSEFYDIYNPVMEMWYRQIWKRFPNYTERMMAYIFITSEAKPSQFIRYIDNNITVPIRLRLWRFIDLKTASAIIMQGGPGTGINAIGDGNWTNSVDGSTGVLYANFTWWSGPVTINPDNIATLFNIRPVEYLGGSNVRFSRTFEPFVSPEWKGKTNRPSILVTPIAPTEDDIYWAMSLTGKVPAYNRLSDSEQSMRTYSTAEQMVKLHKLADFMNGDPTSIEFQDERKNIPFGFRGFYRSKNPVTKEFTIVHNCAGHRSDEGSQPGAAKTWNGSTTMFRPFVLDEPRRNYL